MGISSVCNRRVCPVQTTLIIRVAISNPMVTKSFVVQKLEETPHLPHNEETIEMWLRVMVSPCISFPTTAKDGYSGTAGKLKARALAVPIGTETDESALPSSL